MGILQSSPKHVQDSTGGCVPSEGWGGSSLSDKSGFAASNVAGGGNTNFHKFLDKNMKWAFCQNFAQKNQNWRRGNCTQHSRASCETSRVLHRPVWEQNLPRTNVPLSFSTLGLTLSITPPLPFHLDPGTFSAFPFERGACTNVPWCCYCTSHLQVSTCFTNGRELNLTESQQSRQYPPFY